MKIVRCIVLLATAVLAACSGNTATEPASHLSLPVSYTLTLGSQEAGIAATNETYSFIFNHFSNSNVCRVGQVVDILVQPLPNPLMYPTGSTITFLYSNGNFGQPSLTKDLFVFQFPCLAAGPIDFAVKYNGVTSVTMHYNVLK